MDITWTAPRRDAMRRTLTHEILRATGPDRVDRKTLEYLTKHGLLEFRGSPVWGWVATQRGLSHARWLVSPSRPGPKGRPLVKASPRRREALAFAQYVGPYTASPRLARELWRLGWLDPGGQITELGAAILANSGAVE